MGGQVLDGLGRGRRKSGRSGAAGMGAGVVVVVGVGSVVGVIVGTGIVEGRVVGVAVMVTVTVGWGVGQHHQAQQMG